MKTVNYPSIQLLTDAYQLLETGDRYRFFKFCITHRIENEDMERIFCRYERVYGSDLRPLRNELAYSGIWPVLRLHDGPSRVSDVL